jgi:hypothetical protein
MGTRAEHKVSVLIAKIIFLPDICLAAGTQADLNVELLQNLPQSKRKHKCLQDFIEIYFFFKLHGLSPRANYTDRATAGCRRSDCQLLQIEGATWSA